MVELVLGNELEDGQWTNRLYVISELAAGSDLLQYMKKMSPGLVETYLKHQNKPQD